MRQKGRGISGLSKMLDSRGLVLQMKTVVLGKTLKER